MERDSIRRFRLTDLRDEEHALAEGVQFSDGLVVVRWYGENSSTAVWESIEAFEKVSVVGHDHEGSMSRRVDWID